MYKTIQYKHLNKIDKMFLDTAINVKSQSTAEKRKVGTVIGNYRTGIMLSSGYNKMFNNMWNEKCEDDNGETIPYVIHSEESAIIEFMKCKAFKLNLDELCIYVTYSPCINCCKMIAHSGIKRVVFIEKHEVNFDNCEWAPAEFLHKLGINVQHVII